MNPRKVVFLLLVLLLILAVGILRWRREPRAREPFDRQPATLVFSGEARCQLRCLGLRDSDIRAVMQRGILLLHLSDRRGHPCPTFTLQGLMPIGTTLRVRFIQCANETQVTDCSLPGRPRACDCGEE